MNQRASLPTDSSGTTDKIIASGKLFANHDDSADDPGVQGDEPFVGATVNTRRRNPAPAAPARRPRPGEPARTFGLPLQMLTRRAATLLLLGIAAMPPMARADLITPVASSFSLTAKSEVLLGPTVTSTDGLSQGATINPLSASVEADSTSNYLDSSLSVTASGSATWTAASQGEVSFTNVGWTAVRANGVADLTQGTGWTYTFLANTTGSFVIDYNVTDGGSSSNLGNPLLGLNGFFLYWWPGTVPPENPIAETGQNSTGTVDLAFSAGNTYTIEIQPFAFLAQGIGTTDAHMGGTFDFSAGGNVNAVPELSSMTMAVVIPCLAGAVISLKRALTTKPDRRSGVTGVRRSGVRRSGVRPNF